MIEFFDSLGHTPDFYGFRFPSGIPVRLVLGYRTQSLNTNTCGHYCLFFLFHSYPLHQRENRPLASILRPNNTRSNEMLIRLFFAQRCRR